MLLMVIPKETLATCHAPRATEKKATPFFSIIIPVYNVAPYLRECLDSILAQSFTDWECLCVDDGSTDESGAILDEYAKKDARFRVFHQENRGVSAARNQALACACGEFICFADGDDIAYPWWLSTFAHFQCLAKADLVRVQHPSHRPYSLQQPDVSAVATHFMTDEKAILEWGWPTFSREGYSVLYAIRRSCLGETRFIEGVRLKEDNLFALALLPKITRAIQCEVITYWYRFRATSAMRQPPSYEETEHWVKLYVAIFSAQFTRCQACGAKIQSATSWAILRECVAMIENNAILRLPKMLNDCKEKEAFTPQHFPLRWRLIFRWCENGNLWLLRLGFYWVVCKRTLVRWWHARVQGIHTPPSTTKTFRQFQLFVEPTEYILDLIAAVYHLRGTTCAFAYNRKTLASQGTSDYPVLEQMTFWQRLTFLWQMLKTHHAVAIHSYADPMSITLIMLNLWWRRTLTFEVDSAWREPKRWLPRHLKRAWLGFWFKRPYVWGCAIGAQVHRDFFLKNGLPESRLSERPNVVNNARYVRPHPSVQTDSFTFGYVGRLVSHKEVDTLIAAFREVVRLHPHVTLSIVGDGPEKTTLQAQAADLPQVVFHGAVYGNEKVALQHQMNTLCLVSSYEPWGLVVNEALAGGTPCIVSACCGCAEPLIQGPRAGIIIPEKDPAALVKAMCYMIEHPSEAAAMGQRGARFIQTQWNYTRYARALDHDTTHWASGSPLIHHS